ncbi:hypothetical protein NL676_021556 [Syzygium grande]|nr:hypothetical protein NL676_021556 [Syzygium grande]
MPSINWERWWEGLPRSPLAIAVEDGLFWRARQDYYRPASEGPTRTIVPRSGLARISTRVTSPMDKPTSARTALVAMVVIRKKKAKRKE